ncbi:MAG TPA: PIN domain-containing protein [Anaerolineae bacterium]
MKKIVFPDPSVFLHFSPLDEIDLPQLFDCAEVEVLLTLVVTEELVRHQWDHPVPELRQRARETIRRVEKWLEGQQAIGPGVTASFLGRRPDSETMETYRLNWQRQDDVLLGTLLEYKQARAGEEVILLTGDSDLALRARSLGIEAVALSGEYTLAEAESALQAEKQKLRQDLAGFRYRTPSLSLSFAAGKDEVAVTIAPQLDSLTTTMQAQLVAVADDVRRQAAQHQVEDVVEAELDDPDTLAALVTQASPAGGHSFLEKVAEAEAERYRREVEAYPEKFERYLRRCLEMINEHRRTIRLDLEVENAGGAPAENVLALLTVPEQLEWYWRPGDRDMPAPPAPPTPPRPEDEVLERGFHIGGVSSVPSHLLSRDYISGEAPAGAFPVISESGTQLRWELGTYRHHQSRLLGPLYVRFRRADDISNFAVAYEIQEKNSPGSVRGRLLVFVE